MARPERASGLERRPAGATDATHYEAQNVEPVDMRMIGVK